MGSFVTKWGFPFSVPFKEPVIVADGPNWAIYQRTDPTRIALAFDGTQTHTKVLRNEEMPALIAFAQERAQVPGEPPAPEPRPEAPAKVRFVSTPSTARVRIDGILTGRRTTVTLELEPGPHAIEYDKENYEVVEFEVTAVPGRTITRSRTLTRIEAPPEEPPPEPVEPAGIHITELITKTGEWWAAFLAGDEGKMAQIGNYIVRKITEEPTPAQREAFLQRAKEKLPFMALAMVGIPLKTGPLSGAAAGTADDILKLGANEIRALGLKNPKALLKLIKPLPKERLAELFGKLSTTTAGKHAISTIQRVVLDSRLVIPAWAKLTAVVGGGLGLYQLSHTLNFLGFLGEEAIQTAGIGIFELVANKNWKAAAAALPEYRQTVDAVAGEVDLLMSIPVLNFWLARWWPQTKTAAYQQIDNYATQIATGLAEEETGSIAIETTPNKATIWINDVQQAFPSNTVVEKLVPGNYTVRIQLKAHVEHQGTVEVKSGQQTPFVHEFEKVPEDLEPGSGRIEWEAKDAKTGATVGVAWYIDGRLEKTYSTTLDLDLNPGSYEMRWTAPKYNDYLDTVVIDEGKTLVLRIEMDKIEVPPWEPPPEPIPADEIEPEVPKKGRLEVSANTEAQIFIGGTDTGKKTPSAFELTQGIYTITLKAEGYLDKSTNTLVKPGETSAIALSLAAVDAPPPTRRLARVNVNSAPTGAKILVNGTWTKKYTPDSVLLEPGEYEIGMTKSGFEPWTTPLKLEED